MVPFGELEKQVCEAAEMGLGIHRQLLRVLMVAIIVVGIAVLYFYWQPLLKVLKGFDLIYHS